MAEDIVSPLLADVAHGFLTGPQSDREELARIGGDLPTVFLKQVHSPRVVHVSEPFAESDRPEADALVTDRRGLRLAIVTADCAPVLLADSVAGVIGAAHAGWRGAVAGVLENTLDAMEQAGARRASIAAVIGPTIAQESYEVDEAFRAQFEPADERFFREGRTGHYQFDLPAYVAHRLRDAGTGSVADLALDTYADATRFHSYRRATHRGEPTEGRQISAIALA